MKFKFTGFPEKRSPYLGPGHDLHTDFAENERKATLDRLLTALTMSATTELASTKFSAVVMGTLTGLAQGVLSHFQGDRAELEAAFMALAKESFFMAWHNDGNSREAKDRSHGL